MQNKANLPAGLGYAQGPEKSLSLAGGTDMMCPGVGGVGQQTLSIDCARLRPCQADADAARNLQK